MVFRREIEQCCTWEYLTLSQQHPCLAGYSLTEMLVVLSIVGIIGTWGGVWIKSQLPGLYLTGATRQVRTDLIHARMQAARQGNKFRIRFLDEYQYSILDDDNNNGKPDAGEQLVIKDLRHNFHGVSLQSTNHPIFHPRGTASNLATITLANRQGTRKVKVSITGRVIVMSP